MKFVVNKLLPYLLLAGILFGLFTTIFAPIEMIKKANAESWPSRKAVISKSLANSGRSAKGAQYWKPEICGVYQDNGEKFCATRVRFGSFRFGDGLAEAQEAVERYPVGREVDIYYAPGNPKETLLEAHSSWNALLILFGSGLAMLLLPLFLWIFRAHITRARSSP